MLSNKATGHEKKSVRIDKILTTFFVEGPTEGAADLQAAQVMQDIAESPPLIELFDLLSHADHALLEGSDHPRFDRSFSEAVFFDRLSEQLASEQKERSKVVTGHFGGSVGKWMLAATALLCLAAVALFQPGPEPLDPFQARNAARTTDSDRNHSVSLDTYCVQRNGADGPVFRGANEGAMGVTQCHRGEELKLAYRNEDISLRYLSIVGVAANGTIYWYGPSPADVEPYQIDRATTQKPVGETVRLSVNHGTGPIRVHGIFSENKISFNELQDRFEHQSGALFRTPLEPWHKSVVITTTVFEVVEGETR
jgi:hypothetical protein